MSKLPLLSTKQIAKAPQSSIPQFFTSISRISILQSKQQYNKELNWAQPKNAILRFYFLVYEITKHTKVKNSPARLWLKQMHFH